MTIEIIVVDDHPTTRMGLHYLFDTTEDIRFLADAECGMVALELVSNIQPDILLLDFRLPDMTGPQVTAEILKLNLKTKVLGFSAYSDEDYIFKILEAGAQGYVLKTESPSLLLEAIRAVARGETWLSPTIANVLLKRMRRKLDNQSILSPRELEVLNLLAKGYSNIQIAKSLVISRATVKNHLSNIYESLAVCSRAEAITWAWSNGLIMKETSI
jgi:DNA-binding NarL/FixJ family response regulator